MELLDFLEELDALNEAKFDKKSLNVSTDTVFKFLSSTSDLNSALQSKLIWSNVRTDQLQFDEYCDQLSKETGKSWGFISLTAEPTKVAIELIRPFGIEFDLAGLKKAVSDRGFRYRAVNQLDSTKMRPLKDNDPSQIRLNAVGKDKDGSCWFVLQGNYSPRYIDENTYERLLAWLKDPKNTGELLVHFVNDGRNPLELNKNYDKSKPTSIDNSKYVYMVGDFVDLEGSNIRVLDDYVSDDNLRYIITTNDAFLLNKAGGVGFTTTFRDNIAEIWATCLNRRIGLNSDSGYDTHLYNTSIKPLVQASTGMPYALDKEVFTKVAEALDEYEFRIYLPNTEIFKFDYSWVRSVRLPTAYIARGVTAKVGRTVNLQELFEAFTMLDDGTDAKLKELCDDLLGNELETVELIKLYRKIRQFNLDVKFFEFESPEPNEPCVYLPINFAPAKADLKKAGKDFTRYFLDKSVLSGVFDKAVGTKENAADDRYEIIRLADRDGFPSLVYKHFNPGDGEHPARLEVRGIILGKSEEGDWYISVVHKGSWFELPGGSFANLPSTEAGLLPIAADKLSDETGLSIKASELTLLNDLTYMYEKTNGYIKKLTAGTDLLFPYTVDWTFITVLPDPVDITKQQINNDGVAKWLLWESAKNSHTFMSRYRNLAPVIEDRIKNTKS